MDVFRDKRAVVIGASSGVGRATVKALLAEGVRITAVARGAPGLERLQREFEGGIETLAADASESGFAERLLREIRPDLVVLAAGGIPHLAPLTEQTWESFSLPWSSDAKLAFEVVKAALTAPLASGSTVVVV